MGIVLLYYPLNYSYHPLGFLVPVSLSMEARKRQRLSTQSLSTAQRDTTPISQFPSPPPSSSRHPPQRTPVQFVSPLPSFPRHPLQCTPTHSSHQRLSVQPPSEELWGSLHPDKRSVKQRMKVVWTDEEKQYISIWLNRHANGTSRALYDEVMICPRARQIFHYHHVVTHDRLLHMYKEMKELVFGL